MTSFLLFFGGTVFGMLLLLGYGAYRGTRSDGWDDSNLLNWLRLFSHIVLHPEDFTKMYYLDEEQIKLLEADYNLMLPQRPFPYLSRDEFSGNFPQSRPYE